MNILKKKKFARWRSLQLQVMNSPFSQEQVELLNQLLPELSGNQRIWLGGYLSAVSEAEFAGSAGGGVALKEAPRSEEHTSELQSRGHLVCRLLLEKKNRAIHNRCM